MSLTQRPQPNAPFTAALTRSSMAALTTSNRPLSARQLFDVELGLVLLSQLAPAAAPAHLPALLSDDGGDHWTARQRRCLNRGRALLLPFQQHRYWNDLLDRYSRLTSQAQAFDISHDRSRFSQKTVGFFRNRVRTLRQLLA